VVQTVQLAITDAVYRTTLCEALSDLARSCVLVLDEAAFLGRFRFRWPIPSV